MGSVDRSTWYNTYGDNNRHPLSLVGLELDCDSTIFESVALGGFLMSNFDRLVIDNNRFILGDLSIESGKITAIAETIPRTETDKVIEAKGLTLLPGVIDPQVHFREPGLEYKEDLFTASCACVKGGVTSFLEMPNTRPLTTTQAALDDKLERADLLEANPVCGIKIFMGSMHGDLLVSTRVELEPIFAKGRRLIAVHAEDRSRIEERRQEFAQIDDPAIHSQIQDEIAALNATKLALELSKKYQRRLHILHLSTGIEAEYLRQNKPTWVTAEVTPQHLLLDTTAYAKIGTLAQMNPPLRSPENKEILWKALLDGTIDFIATDHAPHTLAEKAQTYPNTPSGMPGVETSLPLMLTQAMAGRCSVSQVAHWMSGAVAEAYNIPNKGKIAVGYDADLVLVDLENYRPILREELQTKCGWSPFEGWNLTGHPVVTIVGGLVAFDRGKIDTTVRGKALTFLDRV
jgi:dihydroorotase